MKEVYSREFLLEDSDELEKVESICKEEGVVCCYEHTTLEIDPEAGIWVELKSTSQFKLGGAIAKSMIV